MLNKDKYIEIIIDKDKCTKCGICIEACDNFLEQDFNGYPKAKAATETLLGCIQCGRCMMKCPTDAIEIIGEDIDKTHLRAMPENLPDYEATNSLLLKRRSCRKFKQDEVSKEDIDKILSSAATAPVGIPPSEVKVMVFQGRKKVQELAKDLNLEIKKMKKLLSPLALYLLKFTMSENQYKLLTDFSIPLCEAVLNERDKGKDILFYNAPTVIIFYGNELACTEDMILAAANATIAAESLNLGTCFIGAVSYMFNKSSKLQNKYGILNGEKVSTAFILGVPNESYFRTFQRNFKEVKFI